MKGTACVKLPVISSEDRVRKSIDIELLKF